MQYSRSATKCLFIMSILTFCGYDGVIAIHASLSCGFMKECNTSTPNNAGLLMISPEITSFLNCYGLCNIPWCVAMCVMCVCVCVMCVCDVCV